MIRPILLTVLPGALVSAFLDWRAGVGTTVLATGWLLWSILFPRTICPWCRGNSKRRDASGKNWRNCFVCKGSGQRRRLGARILRRHRAGGELLRKAGKSI